ncbi:terpene synthase-like isoform X1 [Zophobas morio]|uniref:terpene synthase-like isoform X1 n=1 Tax=Zophobas morio TaxID=2755281 RepID=UPI0030831EA4
MSTLHPISVDDENKILWHPILHVDQMGPEKSNVMKRLWRAFNYWINCPKGKQRIIAEIGDNLYNVGLLLDDIEDNAILRRGAPAAHLIYGLASTVYAIIYRMIILIEQLLDVSENKEIVTDYVIEAGTQLLRGQGVEIYFRDTCICPTYEDYKHIINDRWVSLLNFGLRMLQLFVENENKDFTSLLTTISVFIQIYNDYINLHNPKAGANTCLINLLIPLSFQYSNVKTYCDDITEGKFTFPMIHAIRTHPDDHHLIDIIRKRPTDLETKKVFVNILESFGSFEYTRKTLGKLRGDILSEVDNLQLNENPYLKRVLEDILNNLETEIYFDRCD